MELVQLTSSTLCLSPTGPRSGLQQQRPRRTPVAVSWSTRSGTSLALLSCSGSTQACCPDAPGRLVNTHHNGDHCWGNQLFAEAGTEIIGHRLCAEYFDARGLARAVRLAVQHARRAARRTGRASCDGLRRFDFDGIELTPPTTLIDGDTRLDLGRHRGRPPLRRPGAHRRRCGRPPSRRGRGVHRRHPVQRVHADRVGGHVRQLDRGLAPPRSAGRRRSSCPGTDRSPTWTACATCASTSSTCTRRLESHFDAGPFDARCGQGHRSRSVRRLDGAGASRLPGRSRLPRVRRRRRGTQPVDTHACVRRSCSVARLTSPRPDRPVSPRSWSWSSRTTTSTSCPSWWSCSLSTCSTSWLKPRCCSNSMVWW